MFQDFDNSESEFRCETFKYEMWVGFADRPFGAIWNIKAENHIVEGEGDRGSMREV